MIGRSKYQRDERGDICYGEDVGAYLSQSSALTGRVSNRVFKEAGVNNRQSTEGSLVWEMRYIMTFRKRREKPFQPRHQSAAQSRRAGRLKRAAYKAWWSLSGEQSRAVNSTCIRLDVRIACPVYSSHLRLRPSAPTVPTAIQIPLVFSRNVRSAPQKMLRQELTLRKARLSNMWRKAGLQVVPLDECCSSSERENKPQRVWEALRASGSTEVLEWFRTSTYDHICINPTKDSIYWSINVRICLY